MNFFQPSPRRVLYRWLGWFFVTNTLIANLVIFGYLPLFHTLRSIPDATLSSSIFAYFYFVLAFFAQTSLFMFLGALVCFIVATIAPWRGFILTLGTLLGTVVVSALIIDTVAYRLFHMHYAVVGFQVIKVGALSEVITLGWREQLIAGVSLITLLLLEFSLAMWLWRIFSKQTYKTASKVTMGILVGIWLFVFTAFGSAIANYGWQGGYRYAILRAGRIVPYLSQIYLALFRSDKAIMPITIDHATIPVVMQEINKPLHYPLHPLICEKPKQKLNIVVIGVDTWRFDSMSRQITPNIYNFAEEALQFKNHFSGGNCTGPGLFSLFYSLPPNYWKAFLNHTQGPVFIKRMQELNYQMGVFLSAPIKFPRFDKTIFVDVKSLNINTPGASSIARDHKITEEFLDFLKQRNNQQPFFSFIFYDAPHNYCESARGKENPFQPAVNNCERFSLDASSNPSPYLNLYNNKVYFIDQEIGKVLAALKQQNLLQNTIVIITGDHGEEMNDGRQGFWGHASDYSAYQLHVPMIVYWPGHHASQMKYGTTHYDVVPTIMEKVLGCQNPNTDYSVGSSLLTSSYRPYFVAGSYGDYAIISPQEILRVYPDGDYELSHLNSHRQGHALIDQRMNEVLKDLQAYFQN